MTKPHLLSFCLQLQDKPKMAKPSGSEADDKLSSSSSLTSDSSDSGDDWQPRNGSRNARGVGASASPSQPAHDNLDSSRKASWASNRLASADNIPGVVAASSRTVGEAGPSTSTAGSAVDEYIAQISHLVARVSDLEAQLSDKDSEMLTLRAHMHELVMVNQSLCQSTDQAASRAVLAESLSDTSGQLMMSPVAPFIKVGSGPAWSAASHASLGSTSDCSDSGTPSHVAGHSAPASAHEQRISGHQYPPNAMYRASSEPGLPPPPPPSPLLGDKQGRIGTTGPAASMAHGRSGIPPTGPSRPNGMSLCKGTSVSTAMGSPSASLRQQASSQQHSRGMPPLSMPGLASVKTGGHQQSGMMQGMMSSSNPQSSLRTPRSAKGVKIAGTPPPPGPPTSQQYAAPRQSAWSCGAPPPPPPPPPQAQGSSAPNGNMANGVRSNCSAPPPPPPGPSGSYRAAAAKIPGQVDADRQSRVLGGSPHSNGINDSLGQMGNGAGDITPGSLAPGSPVSVRSAVVLFTLYVATECRGTGTADYPSRYPLAGIMQCIRFTF